MSRSRKNRQTQSPPQLPLKHEFADVTFYVAFGDNRPFLTMIQLGADGTLRPKILKPAPELTAEQRGRVMKFLDDRIAHLKQYWGASLNTNVLTWNVHEKDEE